MMELIQDTAYALRSLRQRPGFTLAALLTLILGLGATTTLFSFLDQAVLRPLPFANAERLVWISTLQNGQEEVSPPGLVMAWDERVDTLETVAGVYGVSHALTGGDRPERVRGLRVSTDFFETFGLEPSLGRTFSEDAYRPGAHGVVMLSHRLWRHYFAADRTVLGHVIALDGVPHTVLGVMPPIFDRFGEISVDLWTPLGLGPSQSENFSAGYLQVVGRLAEGASLAEAEAELTSIPRGLDLRDRRGDPVGVVLRPFQTQLSRDVSGPFWRLFGATLAVLLIGCVNLTHLLLAQGDRRRGELAVRAALGAGRPRLIRQLLTENAILALLGALGGLLLARVLTRVLEAAIPVEVPRVAQVEIDAPAFLFAVVLAGVASLVAGLYPARRAARVHLRSGLQGGSIELDADGATRRRLRPQTLLVGVEVGLTVLLLVAAGLLLRSSWALNRVDPGFSERRVLTAAVSLPGAEYPEHPRMVATWWRILEGASKLPGVDSAALVSRVPLGGGNAGLGFRFVGQGPEDTVNSRIRIASPGYFDTLGIPLREGRDFTAADRQGTEPAVVVNEALARRLAPDGRSILGRLLFSEGHTFVDADGEPIPWRVVGVVGNLRDGGLRAAPLPALYLPMDQAPEGPWNWIQRQLLLVVRTPENVDGIVQSLRRSVGTVDPNLPVYDVRTLEERLWISRADERLQTGLLSALGAIGLLLSAVGVYGMVHTAVIHRQREIALRMALGADPSAVRRWVHGQVLGPVLVGLAVGALASLALGRILAGQLVGVGPLDPVTLVAVAVLLLLVAAVATDGPLRRALAVDPSEVTRTD